MLLAEASDNVQIATLVAGVATALISAVSVALGAYLAYRTALMRMQVEQNTEGLKRVERATNGMKDQLVAEVRRGAYARGVKSETDKLDGPRHAAPELHADSVTVTGENVTIEAPHEKEKLL